MIEYFDSLTDNENIDLLFLFFFIAIILVETIDWLFGWTNAKFNKNVEFESSKALYGIVKKMMYFVAIVLFSFVTLLIVPNMVAVPSLIVFYTGFLWSELNSVLSHLGLTEDGKKGELFITLMKRIFEYEGDKKQ